MPSGVHLTHSDVDKVWQTTVRLGSSSFVLTGSTNSAVKDKISNWLIEPKSNQEYIFKYVDHTNSTNLSYNYKWKTSVCRCLLPSGATDALSYILAMCSSTSPAAFIAKNLSLRRGFRAASCRPEFSVIGMGMGSGSIQLESRFVITLSWQEEASLSMLMNAFGWVGIALSEDKHSACHAVCTWSFNLFGCTLDAFWKDTRRNIRLWHVVFHMWVCTMLSSIQVCCDVLYEMAVLGICQIWNTKKNMSSHQYKLDLLPWCCGNDLHYHQLCLCHCLLWHSELALQLAYSRALQW